MLETHPHIQVVGPLREDLGVSRAVNDHISGLSEGISLRTEIPHSPERIAQLNGLHDAFLELGHDLGIDLSDRLPTSEKYHFFKTKEDLHTALRELGSGDIDENVDGRTNNLGIFMLEPATDYESICEAAHETIHWAAQKKQKVTEDPGAEEGVRSINLAGPARNGYRLSRTFHAVDEMAADLTYLHLRKGGYWSRQTALPQDDITITNYASLDAIGDELIQDIAQENNVTPRTILAEIERDVFTGSNTGIRLLAEHLRQRQQSNEQPNTRVRTLLHTSHQASNEELRKLAGVLGLPRATNKIRAIEQGQELQVLSWLENAAKDVSQAPEQIAARGLLIKLGRLRSHR